MEREQQTTIMYVIRSRPNQFAVSRWRSTTSNSYLSADAFTMAAELFFAVSIFFDLLFQQSTTDMLILSSRKATKHLNFVYQLSNKYIIKTEHLTEVVLNKTMSVPVAWKLEGKV